MYNNYGNYGNYNPYMAQNRYQPIEQPIQQQNPYSASQNRQILNGKMVESVDVVKVLDIPMEGVSYFPLADGSAIVTKQFLPDGTTKTLVFKPSTEEAKETPKYVTVDELDKAIKKVQENIDLSDIDNLKDKINDLKEDIREIKKSKKKDD